MSEEKTKPEKLYLVKSASQLLGPYSEAEVKNLVKEAALDTSDEAAAPGSYWLPLENHPVFKDFMKSVDIPSRLAQLLTNVSGKKLMTISKTFKSFGGKTETVTDPQTEEAPPSESDLSRAEDIEFEIAGGKAGAAESPPPLDSKYKPVISEERERAAEARRKTAKTIRFFWRLTAALAMGLGAYIVFSLFVSPVLRKNPAQSAQNARAAGLAFYKAGSYDRAFPHFEKALKANVLQTEEKILLAGLLAQRGDGARAEALALEISGELSQKGRAGDPRLDLARGLTALREKDFSLAESAFKKALAHDEGPAFLESSKISLINLALLKWALKDHKSSLKFLSRLTEKGFERGVSFYLKALNLAEMQAPAEEVKKAIMDAIEITPENHQELHALSAYLHAQKQEAAETERAIFKSLNQDPFFSEDCKYSPFLALGLLSWERLLPFCEAVFRSSPKKAVFNSFFGFCLLRAGKPHESFPHIERAKNQAPDDPLILSVYAYSLMSEGALSRAEAALQLAMEETRKKKAAIPRILAARLFEREGSWVMAKSAWSEILQSDPYHLSALAGMAAAGSHLKDGEAVRKYRDRGLGRYPFHVRLLSLQPEALQYAGK